MAKTFRASGPLITLPSQNKLGLLGDLPGTFLGTGFNLIARPAKHDNQPFFLEVNATQEILEFANIGGDIPNRGSVQDDLFLHGLRYLQRVADCETHTAIHLEPGLWLHVPATTAPDPVTLETYVRQATIPHGDSVLAQSTFFTKVNGGPQIDPVDSTPFTGEIPDLNSSPANPITNADYLKQYREKTLPTECLPVGLDAAQTIKNPALVLEAAIAPFREYCGNRRNSDFDGAKRRHRQHPVCGPERQRYSAGRYFLDRKSCRSVDRRSPWRVHSVAIRATSDPFLPARRRCSDNSMAAHFRCDPRQDAVIVDNAKHSLAISGLTNPDRRDILMQEWWPYLRCVWVTRQVYRVPSGRSRTSVWSR